jgi:alkylation response protein AidB-like acyl-CoA dehydrogenase
MFQLSPEQLSLRQRAREVAQTHFAPQAAEIDRTEQYPWENVALLRDAAA